MCNFVPGEVIAIGPIQLLHQIREGLPGDLAPPQPLVTEFGELDVTSQIVGIGSVVLRTEPGLEVYAASQLSARLATAIEAKQAVVDLNHILPLSAAAALSPESLRLSAVAEREATGIRGLLRRHLGHGPAPARVAVLDSGLAPSYAPQRTVRYLDYTAGGRLTPNAGRADPLGHGTRVACLLDQLLPPSVELWVGRVPDDPNGLTALTIAHAMGDLVARGVPDVLNLSLTPRNDWFTCPSCRKRVPAPTFLSTFLPLVVRLAGRSASHTYTVMAAGNEGQIPNSRWLTGDIDTLLFAVAENSRHERARYSGAPEGPHADLFSAGAFGGDDPDDPGRQGVFLDGVHGTSFAAPFVSALALVAKKFHPPVVDGYPSRAGAITRSLIDAARTGIPFTPPGPAPN